MTRCNMLTKSPWADPYSTECHSLHKNKDMEDKEFDNEVKKLRRMHTAGIVILITLTGLAHIFANKSTATSPIIIFKSILLLYMFINIPLMAWQYNKTLKRRETTVANE